MPNLFVDVETTGFGHKANPPREDAVLQIGLAWRDSKNNIQTWSRYCNPGERFFENGRAESALKINGITKDTTQSAQTAEKIAQEFWNVVFELETKGNMAKFYSYNVAFDAPFLAQTPWSVPSHRFGDCVMLKAQVFMNYYKWPKLEDAVRRLGINWPKGPAHDAAVDAHAALLVFEAIQDHSSSVPSATANTTGDQPGITRKEG